jgi:signal transduction histidine kinase
MPDRHAANRSLPIPVAGGWDESPLDGDERRDRDGSSLVAPSEAADTSGVERSTPRISPWTILAVATGLGIFSSLQAYNYIQLFQPDSERPFYFLVALNVTYWYAWAILMPGMFWMARRYRFGRGTWRSAAAMHCLGVLAFTFTHAVLTISSRWLIIEMLGGGERLIGRPFSFQSSFEELFFLNFDWEMMTYWAVIGLSHALDFHRESQERELTSAHLQTRLAEANLQALQRQLHPHFLFNTLHTISALMHRDTEAADAMLERLSDLLRLTLDRVGTQQVCLKDELDFIDKYVEIERARFGDRLRVVVDVDPGILDASVPNLLLQPLVENAVRHGIAPKVGGGTVQIVARREGDRLQLIVRDNGFGLPADTLQAFNKGVGVSNTRSRLEHLFGDRHRFEFQRPQGGGLAVTIEIPFSMVGESPGASPMESVA